MRSCGKSARGFWLRTYEGLLQKCTVVSVKKQWWLKVNTKPVRMHALDGAAFPHIIKVSYMVNGTEYFKRKWIRACDPQPNCSRGGINGGAYSGTAKQGYLCHNDTI